MRSWEDKALVTIYLVVAFGSLAAAVAVLVRGDIGQTGLDGLFLLLVCLLFAVVFGLLGAQTMRQTVLADFLERRRVARAARPPVERAAAASISDNPGVAQQQSKAAR